MSTQAIHTYKDLIVWQKAMDLVTTIYEITKKFPVSEQFGLTSQMQRSAVSIPSNIAEGRRRGTKKQYHNFLRIAYASGAELETQIEITKRLSLGQNAQVDKAVSLLTEVMKMLNALMTKLNARKTKS